MNAIRETQFIASPVQEESKKVDDHPKVDIQMSRADELIKNLLVRKSNRNRHVSFSYVSYVGNI